MNSESTAPTPVLGYQPGLDGLRAVAVLAVMAFHADFSWALGGYLGVDIFFVLSGFLITTLLHREWLHHQGLGSETIHLGRFYMRRTLRLLPALLLLVVVLNIYSLWWVWFPHQVEALRRETVAALFYVANWAMVFGYIDPMGLLGHTWSLAIEEQFYMLWPLAFAAMLRRWSHRGILMAIAAGAAASALARALLWHGPESFSRVYHASDTRADALLIGCFVALLLEWGGEPSAALRRTLRLFSRAAAVVLAVMLSQAGLLEAWMYRGGLTVAALAVALLVVELRLAPEGGLARALSWRPLVGVGRISYGLYLWHMPVFLIFAPRFLEASFATVTLVRFAVTFAAAIVSYFAVERWFLLWKRKWEATSA